MSPWTRWQQGKWRCSWRAPTPDHSVQRRHHPFSRNSLPFMNARHSPKLHFSPHSAPLSSRLGTERVAFCSPGCQKGRGGGQKSIDSFAVATLIFVPQPPWASACAQQLPRNRSMNQSDFRSIKKHFKGHRCFPCIPNDSYCLSLLCHVEKLGLRPLLFSLLLHFVLGRL